MIQSSGLATIAQVAESLILKLNLKNSLIRNTDNKLHSEICTHKSVPLGILV